MIHSCASKAPDHSSENCYSAQCCRRETKETRMSAVSPRNRRPTLGRFWAAKPTPTFAFAFRHKTASTMGDSLSWTGFYDSFPTKLGLLDSLNSEQILHL